MDQWLPGPEGGVGVAMNTCGVSFGWWKCSEIRGDDYKTLWIYETPLSWTLQKGGFYDIEIISQ